MGRLAGSPAGPARTGPVTSAAMAVDNSAVGTVSGRSVVTVERGPAARFALAVKDPSPAYQDPRAAAEAGFERIPTPPTWPFSMGFWGTFPEAQEGLEPVGPNPMWSVMAGLGPGLILHGEQEFEFHRPVLVGDVLRGEDVLTDVYEKDAPGVVMTFIVTETAWTDANTGEPVVTARFNLIHRAKKA